MMVKPFIEVIFEECGWVFNTDENAWRLGRFKVSKDKLSKALAKGQDVMLRKRIVDTLSEVEGTPEIEATIERLRPRKKK